MGVCEGEKDQPEFGSILPCTLANFLSILLRGAAIALTSQLSIQTSPSMWLKSHCELDRFADDEHRSLSDPAMSGCEVTAGFMGPPWYGGVV